MKGYINTINKSLKSEFTYIKKLIIENDRMKVNGSIALLNQITTISKIRIYDPKTKTDALNNVKISDENLKNIDNELKKMLIESIDKWWKRCYIFYTIYYPFRRVLDNILSVSAGTGIRKALFIIWIVLS